jgi:hypothetical protein
MENHPRQPRLPATTEALVDMQEWTLCADQPVYAHQLIDTKPRSP